MSERITAEPTIPETTAPAPTIKIHCPACTNGLHHNGGVCWRCLGKTYLTGEDLTRNAKYDTTPKADPKKRAKQVRWVVMLSRGEGQVRRVAPRAYGNDTEIFVRDDQTAVDGTRRAVRPQDLKPGMVAVVAHVETGELIEATVEQIKPPIPVAARPASAF